MKTYSIKFGVVLLFIVLLSSAGFAQSGIISTAAGTGEEGFNGYNGFATSMMLRAPRGVTVDSMGNIYFSDSGNFRVCKVTSEGIFTTIAGTGISAYGGDGGLATAATLSGPTGTAIDTLGNLYIADQILPRIRKINAAGTITTVAGDGTAGFGGDGGPATSANLSNPQYVAVDAVGNLYIADSGNNRIRKVNEAGIITTIAGNGTAGFGGDGGLATGAQLNNPIGISFDVAGNLYIADYYNNRIRKVDAAGIISTVAGNGSVGFDGDGGPAIEAQLLTPENVWVDEAGNLFITDYGNDRVRKVDTNGIISTIAGTGLLGFSGDGGPAAAAKLYYPLDIAGDSDGNLIFADVGNNRIRKISGSGATTTYFPQVAVGGGYATFFSVTNTGSVQASANLILTDSEGLPLAVNAEVRNPGEDPQTLTDSSFSIVIPPGGVAFVSASALNPGDPTKVGWARLTSLGGSLTAVATYEYSVGGTIQTMVGILQTERLQYATIPVDNNADQRKQLGYALANPSGQMITIKLAVVSQGGTVVDDTISIALGPKEQMTRYLWQDFDEANFQGSLVFRGQSGATFAVLGVLEKQNIYTSLPIVPAKAPGIPN